MSHRYPLFTICWKLWKLFPLLLVLLAQPSLAESNAESIPEEASPTIVLGHNPQNRYVVVIPSSDNQEIRAKLFRIREKIAVTGQMAFITRNHLGSYIYVSSFPDRSNAEAVIHQFLKQELNARVVYFP